MRKGIIKKAYRDEKKEFALIEYENGQKLIAYFSDGNPVGLLEGEHVQFEILPGSVGLTAYGVERVEAD